MDPLYPEPGYIVANCGGSRNTQVLDYIGAGVPSNTGSSRYTIAGVDLVEPRGVSIKNVYLVPGVEPFGMMNSDMTEPFFLKTVKRLNKQRADIPGREAPWPWQDRVQALGATLEPGESGELIVSYDKLSRDWSFEAIRVTYTDGSTQYEHVQPISATSRQC